MSNVSNDPEIDDIRKRMSVIRREMHVDFQTAVQSAERLFDWKGYLTRYRWIALAVAAGVGYLAAPARRGKRIVESSAATATATGSPAPDENLESPRSESPKSRTKGEMIGLAFGILGPIVVRVAQSYAISAIERRLNSFSQLNTSSAANFRPKSENIDDASRTDYPRWDRPTGRI